MDYIACLVKFGGHNLNGFTPNSTGRIENTLYASLVELGIIPMNSTGIYLKRFTPNLTSISCLVEFQIRPGMKYWSNWVEIH